MFFRVDQVECEDGRATLADAGVSAWLSVVKTSCSPPFVSVMKPADAWQRNDSSVFARGPSLHHRADGRNGGTHPDRELDRRRARLGAQSRVATATTTPPPNQT